MYDQLESPKSMDFVLEIIKAINNSIGMEKATLHEPNFSGNERKYLLECLESNFVSTVGKHVKRFEDDLANSRRRREDRLLL